MNKYQDTLITDVLGVLGKKNERPQWTNKQIKITAAKRKRISRLTRLYEKAK